MGLIETQVVDDREQPARRICLGNLPQALHAGEKQGHPGSLEKTAPVHESGYWHRVSFLSIFGFI